MVEGSAAPVAVVLAAGASQRLGRPKALVPVAGHSNLALQVQRLHRIGLQVVVVGREDVDLGTEGLPCVLVQNPQPEAGRTGSLQDGLAAFVDVPLEVLVCPVDRPGWNEAVVHALLARPGNAVVPATGGRGGHPLLLRGDVVRRVLRADRSTPLRDLTGARVQVEVDAPFLHLNLDRPEDLAHLVHLEAWLRDGEGP